MAKERGSKSTPTMRGKKDLAIPEKKKIKSAKHEAPSSSLSMDGMNRASRRKLLKEQGLLIERNVGNNPISFKSIPARSTRAGSATIVQKQPSQGEKIYSCLHTGCNETFEGWKAAKNHMMCCKIAASGGEKNYEGKPNITASRKKGNELLISGEATKKVYTIPADETELVKAIRDFQSKNSSIPMSGKGSLTDEAYMMRRVIRRQWGSDLKDFGTLGFGTWQEFLDNNDMSVEDADLESDSE